MCQEAYKMHTYTTKTVYAPIHAHIKTDTHKRAQGFVGLFTQNSSKLFLHLKMISSIQWWHFVWMNQFSQINAIHFREPLGLIFLKEFLKIILIWKAEFQIESSIYWFTSQRGETAGTKQTQGRELLPGLTHGFRSPSIWAILFCFPKLLAKNENSQDFNKRPQQVPVLQA